MFGINWIKIIGALAILSVIITAGYFSYKFVTDLQIENAQLHADKATLESNVVKLTESIEVQVETLNALNRDISLQRAIIQDTTDEFDSTRQRVRNLEEQLSKHELGFLAANKPGLVENVINAATVEINRCFEIASGAPLTVAERNATLLSEINSECTNIANPNFKGTQ